MTRVHLAHKSAKVGMSILVRKDPISCQWNLKPEAACGVPFCIDYYAIGGWPLGTQGNCTGGTFLEARSGLIAGSSSRKHRRWNRDTLYLNVQF